MKDFDKKQKAVILRKQGESLSEISIVLKTPKSTLSGWLKDVKIPEKFKKILQQKRLDALIDARKKAADFHRQEKLKRIKVVNDKVINSLKNVYLDKITAELIFSSFYLAEGAKGRGVFLIANSNPKILQGFFKLMKLLYPLNKEKIRCHIFLRMDQPEKELKKYWSKILDVPEKNFIKSHFDKRAISKTKNNYKGVCSVYYYDVNFQDRVMAAGEWLLEKIKNIDNLDD